MTLATAKGTAGGGRSGTTGAPAAPKALAAAIEVIASFVAGFEPARYSGADAGSLVEAFARAERLCAAGKTLAATRVVDSHTHEHAGHRSGAEWLASVTGEPVGRAVDVLKLGESLEHHPGVDEAFRSGRLSPTRAALVARAASVNPGREEDLVDGARGDTFRQLRDRCLRAKAEGRSDRDARAAYAAIQRGRRCRTWTDEDGAFCLDARLCPDTGAALASALADQSNRHFERARTAEVHEANEAYAADALVALVTGQGLLGPGTTRGSDQTDQTSSAQPAGHRTGRAPGPKATVHLRVDLDALRRGSLDHGEVCEIPGVGPVPVERARDLLGDALCDLVITNGVDVTTVCHLGRSIPAALNTALIERDRCCVVPGCDVALGLERDHWAISFAQGGPASLENLARLCSHHHYERTHRGFQLHGGPGRWRWEPPATPKAPARRKHPDKRTPKGTTTARKTTARKATARKAARKAGPTQRTDPDDPTLFTTRE
ncbi:MAG TPA: HNH endonuclease signature motif containing protein [Acidimicrobiales bacterium]